MNKVSSVTRIQLQDQKWLSLRDLNMIIFCLFNCYCDVVTEKHRWRRFWKYKEGNILVIWLMEKSLIWKKLQRESYFSWTITDSLCVCIFLLQNRHFSVWLLSEFRGWERDEARWPWGPRPSWGWRWPRWGCSPWAGSTSGKTGGRPTTSERSPPMTVCPEMLWLMLLIK